MISIIVAITKNYGIGKDNELLVHISEDLKRFKKLTTGHHIIMGRRTFQSLPKGALPNRTNVVITDIKDESFDGCVMAYSLDDALRICSDDEESFIIGGGMIYKQFYPIADRLYLTIVDTVMEADTFFPEVNFDEWEEISREEHKKDDNNQWDYTYLILEKKSK